MPVTPHTASDVMTRTVVAVGWDTSFKEIARTVRRWKASAMPVRDREEHVVGVVSEADLLPKEECHDSAPRLVEQGRRPDGVANAGGVTAGDLMSASGVTVRADATPAQAARIMAVRRVKRLPVVDDGGRLRGVVSRADLLKVFLRPDEEIEEEVRRTVVSSLFPALSHGVRVHVRDGVVTLEGHIRDTSLISLAVRLARAVEGVVGVEPRLTGEPAGRPE
ncbi:CBS domain-containing protein [Streptomyces cellulosae]|uniref:CBS domain-containing protein n=1 Tax=Streptomyces cellulosae TaxID=1968 RepID=A0ABW6JGY1_STRCE